MKENYSNYLKEIKSTKDYVIYVDEDPTYKEEVQCIKCERFSYSKNDVRHPFCGRCNKFHGE